MAVLAHDWAWFVSIMHLAGWASALHVLHTDRSPQATVGWTLALLLISPIGVPFYWTFGARRYRGYRKALRHAMITHGAAIEDIFKPLHEHAVVDREAFAPLEPLSPFPLTTNNHIELLIDGARTYASLFEAMEQAEDYILAEYFIIADDALGREFMDLLKRKAAAGIRVYVLYDVIGSHRVHRLRARHLRKAGVRIHRFGSPRFPASYLHVNFRNHRKICVVDGRVGFVGGLNVGDLYLSRNPRLSPWRDTHLRVEGPSTKMLQAVFLGDWFWATGEQLQLSWTHSTHADARSEVAILPTGPADPRNFCTLMFLALIHQAEKRIWITTPYLVPTDAIVASLESAAIRGVDVRILCPDCADHRMAFHASRYFAHRLRQAGVRIFRGPGFVHQKVALIDRKLATVGTVNLDTRSLELNFEVTAIVTDPASVAAVDQMLQADFAAARATGGEWREIGHLKRTAARVCRLFSPLL